MKIPLEHEPFAPVTLSRAQEQQLQWLSDALLEETLAENDDFVYRSNRTLDKAKWKQVIARENVAIYKNTSKDEERGGCSPDVDLFDPTQEPRSRYWRLPQCVGVGTLAGSLDDLLYGALAPTTAEYKVRTSYTKDDAADTRVLATIVRPTEEEPMRSMSVRWTLLCQAVHKVIISPRDIVHVDSMGTRILPNGERIGYIIHQSVDLPGCGELTHLGLVRAKYMSCFVFRDTGYGAIELYMRAFMDPGGKLTDGMAVFSAGLALISIWRYMVAGQNKKLAYMARTRIACHEKRPLDVFAQAREDSTKNCPLCLRSLPSFRSPTRCDLCQTKMCSRCVDKRKLTHVRRDGKLVRVTTLICKTCLMMAGKMNANDIAMSEQLPSASRSIRLNSRTTSSSSGGGGGGSQPHQSPNFMAWLNRDSAHLRQSSDTITSESTSWRGTHHGAYSYADSVTSVLDSDASLSSPSMFLRSSAQSVTTGTVHDEAEVTWDKAQFELWSRMNQLRVAADETHMLMKQYSGVATAESEGTHGSFSTNSSRQS